jgi:hypothetical protein
MTVRQTRQGVACQGDLRPTAKSQRLLHGHGPRNVPPSTKLPARPQLPKAYVLQCRSQGDCPFRFEIRACRLSGPRTESLPAMPFRPTLSIPLRFPTHYPPPSPSEDRRKGQEHAHGMHSCLVSRTGVLAILADVLRPKTGQRRSGVRHSCLISGGKLIRMQLLPTACLPLAICSFTTTVTLAR